MSFFGDWVSGLPNQWSDLDLDSMLTKHAENTDLAYDKLSPEWAKEGTLGDYGKHLFQTSASGGNPLTAYATDYKSRVNNGMSSSEALNEQFQNAGISAGILAAIFGGGALFGGGGGVSGSASGIYTTPLEGTLQGLGATGTPISTFTGGGTLASYLGTEANPSGQPFSVGDTNYDAAGNIASINSGNWWDGLLESLAEGGGGQSGGGSAGGQQSGGYDSILENMLKLSPWTVARRDPNRMAQLLALLKGGQGGVLGY